MPSSATSSSIAATGSPSACSASTRWITVSCAIRRTQKPTVWSGSYHVGVGSSGLRASNSAISSA